MDLNTQRGEATPSLQFLMNGKQISLDLESSLVAEMQAEPALAGHIQGARGSPNFLLVAAVGPQLPTLILVPGLQAQIL